MMWTRENFRTGMSGRDTVSGQGIFAKKEMLVRLSEIIREFFLYSP